MEPALPPLPATFVPTRESLRALACYVIAPARKQRTGRIGLRSVGDGIGTPPFDDGSRLVLSGDRLAWEPGASIRVSSVRAAAEFVGVGLSEDPGVGHDLPPFAPDQELAVDLDASLALGAWYAFAQRVLDTLPAGFLAGTITEAQLWPEHFDLAVTISPDSGENVNVGFSPGDGFEAEPYVYVGPHSMEGRTDAYWNAPFGAYLPYASLTSGGAPEAVAMAFILDGLGRLTRA